MSEIDLAAAETMIRAALLHGRAAAFKPLSALVLDAGGHVKAFLREDGASNSRFVIAHGKAYGALALGIGSRALMARAIDQPSFIGAVNGALGGQLIPAPGGVLVRDASGALLGAVGVTGDTSDNDERAAVAGIEAAGYIAETG
jgi:uncharacterized protein GlcG (DUF336 family)